MEKEFDELHQEIADFLRVSRNEFQDPVRLSPAEVTVSPTPPKSFTQEYREWDSDPIVQKHFIKPMRNFTVVLTAALIPPLAVAAVTGDASLTAIVGYVEQAAIIVGMGVYTIKQTLDTSRMRRARLRG